MTILLWPTLFFWSLCKKNKRLAPNAMVIYACLVNASNLRQATLKNKFLTRNCFSRPIFSRENANLNDTGECLLRMSRQIWWTNIQPQNPMSTNLWCCITKGNGTEILFLSCNMASRNPIYNFFRWKKIDRKIIFTSKSPVFNSNQLTFTNCESFIIL